MAIREGRWDCASCGRTGNRGPERYCSGCGAPRGADVRFYLPPDAAEVTDAAALAAAKVGPDWTCGYCGSDNRGSGAFCTQCGAGQDGSAPRPVVDHPIASPPPPPPVLALGPKKRGARKGCLLVVGVLVALLGLQSWRSRTREVELTPIAHSWVRSVAVQALRPVEEEGWEGELPANAQVLSSWRELYRTDRIRVGTRRESKTITERVQAGTERVRTGSRDLGNGYFEDIYEDRPVYRDERRQVTETVPVYEDRKIFKNRVRYATTKWVTVRTETAKGSTPDLRWPDARLAAGEQLGDLTESLEVQLRDEKGRTFTYRVPNETDFRRMIRGRGLAGEVKGGEVKSLALDGR